MMLWLAFLCQRATTFLVLVSSRLISDSHSVKWRDAFSLVAGESPTRDTLLSLGTRHTCSRNFNATIAAIARWFCHFPGPFIARSRAANSNLNGRKWACSVDLSVLMKQVPQ